jgi:predicted membrane-bound spermidine synthase
MHAVRTADLYLTSDAASFLAPSLGAAAGLACARSRRDHAEDAPFWFIAAGVCAAACSWVPFLAFGGTLANHAAVACVAACAGAVTAALALAARAHARWSWALHFIAFAVHPLRLLAAFGIGAMALYLSARAGHLRSGLGIAAWLALVAAAYVRSHEFLEGRPHPRGRAVAWASVVALAIALLGWFSAERVLPLAELDAYAGEVVHARSGASHRYVVVAVPSGHELFEDSVLVASPLDGRRHAQALVEPALSAAPLVPGSAGAGEALVLFGGTGAIERELLRAPRVATVTVIVADPELTRVSAGLRWLEPPGEAPRLRAVVAEPLPWLRDHASRYAVIVANLPPPLEHRAGKYYTRYFFELLSEHLAPGGVVSFPAASAYSARAAFEDILATARAADLRVTAHHAALPALGLSSFLVGARSAADFTARGAFDTGRDLAPSGTGKVARLHDQHVVEALLSQPFSARVAAQAPQNEK